MGQAILPENLEPNTLATMMEGEIAYTLPWGMWVDRKRNCWLCPSYPAEPQPGGTVQMKVELREDGYHVWVNGLGHTWQPSDDPCIVGSRKEDFLPIAELHTSD